MKYKYNCKDNDNKLKFIGEDAHIDEIWIKNSFDKGWTVIGFDDLRIGLELALNEFRRKRSG